MDFEAAAKLSGARFVVLKKGLARLEREAGELANEITAAEGDSRTARERLDERKRATERLVVELLPAIDNLERAIEHTTADNDINHLVSGVTSVHAQIVNVLTKEGVTVIDPVGQPFDPAFHNAVMQEAASEVPDCTVLNWMSPVPSLIVLLIADMAM